VADSTHPADRRHPVQPFSERSASEILESIADPLVAFDKQYRYTYVSPRACEALGKAPRELLGQCMWDIFPGDARTGFQDLCNRAWESGQRVTIERYSEVLGRWVESYVYPFADGAVTQWRDVTERKHAEQALRQSEERFRLLAAELEAVMETVPIAIMIARDPECREIVGNRLIYEMHRRPFGTNLSMAPPPDQPAPSYRILRDGVEIPPAELPIRKAAASGQPVRDYELDLVLEDGASYTLLGHAVPLLAHDGRPAGAVAAFLDVTELKRNDERLRQTQKLESLGLLAGGIAHDFNNLLTGIMGHASMIVDDVSPEVAEQVQEVIASAERAAHLTRQLLAYSGKGQFVVRELDVSQAINEIANLVQFSIPRSVDLALTVQQRLPAVRMDPSQFQQIVMNLVINAGEAIGEGNPGKVAVGTSMTDVDAPFIDAAGVEVAPGRYVCIDVADTGCGIDSGKIAKLFEPFFTTKFTGRGLGLAAVAGIVRAQKGGITVQSVPGSGTTFRVLLPADKRAAEQPESQPAVAGRVTILVVDDEASVRDFIGAVLRRHGHRVLTAFDGRDAMGIFEREEGKIDAVVLDVVMPVMGANDLLPRLKQQKPDMKVLLTSGYNEAEARRLCATFPGATFIQKPYTAQQIGKAVEQLLG
jgi:PAS domain S-box-containing protein